MFVPKIRQGSVHIVLTFQADYADEEYKQETLAARFATVEKAAKWETAFEEVNSFHLCISV